MTDLSAHCGCGALTISFTEAPLFQLVCHCNDCRAHSGEAFLAGVFFAANAATVRGSVRQVSELGGSGKTKHHQHCSHCDELVFVTVDALRGALAVRAQAMQAPFQFQPAAHAWVSQKCTETVIPDTLLSFQRQPSLSAILPAATKPAC